MRKELVSSIRGAGGSIVSGPVKPVFRVVVNSETSYDAVLTLAQFQAIGFAWANRQAERGARLADGGPAEEPVAQRARPDPGAGAAQPASAGADAEPEQTVTPDSLEPVDGITGKSVDFTFTTTDDAHVKGKLKVPLASHRTRAVNHRNRRPG